MAQEVSGSRQKYGMLNCVSLWSGRDAHFGRGKSPGGSGEDGGDGGGGGTEKVEPLAFLEARADTRRLISYTHQKQIDTNLWNQSWE